MVTAFAAVLIPVVLLFLAAVQMRNFRREIESLQIEKQILQRQKQALANEVEPQRMAYLAREKELGGLRFYKREDGKFTLTVPDANANGGVNGRFFVVEWQAP